MRRVVADVAPRYVFAENVSKEAIDCAADDLESMGYTARCISLSAADLGSDHIRERHWLLAHADDKSQLRSGFDAEMAGRKSLHARVWEAFPDQSGMADGLSNRMDRYGATGNGQVPIVAATAFDLLSRSIKIGTVLIARSEK
jgi:DNA (cytosine-5)-methyltransferase 1